MKMEWTDKQPTENGYYWARGLWKLTTIETREIIEIVHVIGFDIEEPEIETCGTDSSTPLSAYTHWIGPLEVPQFIDETSLD